MKSKKSWKNVKERVIKEEREKNYKKLTLVTKQ